VDLAHPALGDVEHLADLAEREALVVVERQHELLPLRQPVDGGGEHLLGLLHLERGDRAGVAVGDRVADGHGLTPIGPDRDCLLEGDEPEERDLPEQVLEVVLGHAELLRHLAVGRGPVQVVLELAVRLLDGARLRPHRARHPVDRAQLVDDRAADPGDGIRLELVAAAGVELVDGVDQPEHAIADEVGLLDRMRESGRHPAGDVLHQRGVVEDQPVADVDRPLLFVALPQAVDAPVVGRTLDIGHARGCVVS
jgi:hypothetical protein